MYTNVRADVHDYQRIFARGCWEKPLMQMAYWASVYNCTAEADYDEGIRLWVFTVICVYTRLPHVWIFYFVYCVVQLTQTSKQYMHKYWWNYTKNRSTQWCSHVRNEDATAAVAVYKHLLFLRGSLFSHFGLSRVTQTSGLPEHTVVRVLFRYI